MSTIANLILDNDVILQEIDANNIKDTLGQFMDSKIYKEHVQNILLNNIILNFLGEQIHKFFIFKFTNGLFQILNSYNNE